MGGKTPDGPWKESGGPKEGLGIADPDPQTASKTRSRHQQKRGEKKKGGAFNSEGACKGRGEGKATYHDKRGVSADSTCRKS